MVPRVYGSYRWPEAPNPRTAHLHDNALQIAAERGIPCLAWWLWLVAAAMGHAWREIRRCRAEAPGGRPDPCWVARAALAILGAVMVAGLFEYNFGDSEILMFTLLVAALPFSLARQRAVPA
jgi:O-antigen ligase